MKIAVTGASGFVGRYVIAELNKYEVDIIAISRQSSFSFREYSKVVVVNLDISRPPTDVYNLVGSPDILIHLAWGGLNDFLSIDHMSSELPIHYNFLKLMIKSGLRTLFVSGTCLEYGLQSGPLAESMTTYPICSYGVAKNRLRKQLELLGKQFPVNMKWGRIFYTYGDGQAQGSLFTQLKLQVEQGNILFNMSGGEQIRDFLSIKLVAKYIVEIAMSDKNIGTINICSGKPISVKEIVETWIAENAWDIELNLGYYTYPQYEPMSFWGDVQKLKNNLTLL